jgi:hypothetical protein
MEKPWRPCEDNGDPPDQPDIGGGHVVLSQSFTMRDIRGTLQPSIEPTSVTAGHTLNTNLSNGGL